ncbi:MAG: copper chaperone PCu(A)C [Marinobacter sp.]|uniref:copper chaperone PCu(A)C n=1 Tax=Marinobacter sp. TaxID=50741 RepID=UPI00299F0A94|nr:copper chaperone PCu(A)C [Marinobacter sp.]MDX1634921.1 copper chaperone PCu(A)C [Marinobacter sp.]
MTLRLPGFLVLSCLLATPVAAHEYSAGPLTIDHPWSRPTPPAVSMAAGYMTITNNGDNAVTLVGASSPRAQNVSIHENRIHMEMLRMEPMPEGLVIEAGKTVELKPRGYHLMLEMIDQPLEEGQRVPLTLRFEGAPEVQVELAVQPLGGEVMGHDHNGAGNESGGHDH